MINTNVTDFQKDIYGILENTIRYNQPVNISTKDGNAVIISEADYQNLIETLYITSIPQMKEKIADGLATPLSECIPESEVKW
ncbi:MAG: type II toxin-antitoxin system Phd/YefM family antitoxin [Oscillospiraceae bacterium]|nr:type II toxin-antitoxin system Phd/YefM family antitoxin [Oscillospiraceae bacterium]